MATIYICDGCKKELDPFDAVRFLGSKLLHGTIFCQTCFESVENYMIDKYKINVEKKIKYEQNRP